MIRTLAVVVAVAVAAAVSVVEAVTAELIQLKREMTKVRMYNILIIFKIKIKMKNK